MEKQSTSKFLRSVIAVVALFMLVVSGLFLASCKEEECSHPTTNDFGACTECNVIVDWTKYEAKLNGLISTNVTDLTASLNDLKSQVSDVASDVDSVITKIGDIDLGADITTIVDTVNNIRDEIVALLGAEEVTDKATPATITGIAKALDDLQASVNKVQEDITGVEKVCKDHDFDTETLIEIIPATCTENGLGYYRCKNCNAVISQPIEAKGHTEVVTETPVKAGDCTSQITVTTTCSVCGETLKTETKDGYADHEWVIDEESSTATCTDAGEVTYTCAHEGCTETKKEDVDALGHTPDEGKVTTQPTCTTEGVKTFTCTLCGEVVREEAVEKVPHTYPVENRVWKYTGDIVFNFEINGTKVDKITQTQYNVCSVCANEEVVVKEDGKTPVTRDTYHSLYIADATFADGNGDVRAKDKLTAEDMVKFGLNEGGINADKFVNDYVNVSCAETAQLLYLCNDTDCPVKDEHYITVDLPALEHVYVADTTKKDVLATCTSTGIHYEVCSACGTTHEEVTKMIDHTYGDAVVVEPTCEENGTRTFTCDVCEKVITETYDPTEPDKNLDLKALGHDTLVDKKVDYVSDFTHKVTTTTTCKRTGCDYELVEEAFESHGALVFETEDEAEAANVKYGYGFNIYQAKDGKFYFTDASCDDNGVRIYLCECGYWWEDTDFATKYVDKLGHEYGEAVKVEGDCVTGGYSIFVCERCGDSYAVTYDQADGHVWKIVAADPSDCTTNGNYAYAYCSVCGAVLKLEDQTLTEADEATLDKFEVDYVEGLNYLTDKEVVEEYFFDEADGHSFDKVIDLRVKGCTDPIWQVTVCSKCSASEDPNKVAILKADPEGFTQEKGYVATDLSAMAGLTAEQKAAYIKDIVDGLNYLDNGSFKVEDIVDGKAIEGWNFTGLTFIAAKGHTLNKYQSVDNEGKLAEGTVAAAVCVADANIVSYAKALEYAQIVYPDVDETAFKAAFDAIFGAGKSDDPSFEIKTDGTKPALAGFCTQCGLPIAVAEHDVVYNMYVVTNGVNGAAYVPGETINYNTAHVSETLFYVVDKDGNLRVDENGTPIGMTNEQIAEQSDYTKAVYTYEWINTKKYTNPNGSVNCYFYSYCANCNEYDGTDRNHTYPTSADWGKYPSCMQGGYCLWCDELLLPISGHNMVDLEEIAASDNEKFKAAAAKLYAEAEAKPEEYPWVGKDTVADMPCEDAEGNTNIAEKWDIQVCVSCLVAWAEKDLNFDGWVKIDDEDPENDGNYSYTVEKQEGKHDFKLVDPEGNIVTEDTVKEVSCTVGYYERYVCRICGYWLKKANQDEGKYDYTKDFEELNDQNYVAETYSPAKPHTAAPIVGYDKNSNFKPADKDHAAYMNFICVECGIGLQAYYDSDKSEDGQAFTHATAEQIAEYNAKFETPQVQEADEEDTKPVEAVEPPVTGGDEDTDQGGEGTEGGEGGEGGEGPDTGSDPDTGATA